MTAQQVTFPMPEGTTLRQCASCAAPIWWRVTAKGRRMPVDPDGTPHWATCPHSAGWKGRKRGDADAPQQGELL